MNNALQQLQPYPFEKLRALLGSVTPNPDKRPVALSIGEPKHASPAFVAKALADNLDKMAVYPTTAGIPALREAIASWCERRFSVPQGWLDAGKHVLPVNGTREALFAFTQTVVNRSDDGLVVSPNPFYQIYEGAALPALPGRTRLQPGFRRCSGRDLEALPDPLPLLAGQPDWCVDPAGYPEKAHRPG